MKQKREADWWWQSNEENSQNLYFKWRSKWKNKTKQNLESDENCKFQA